MKISILLLVLLLLIPVYIFVFRNRRKKRDKEKIRALPFPDTWREILNEKVSFYKNLGPGGKERFENRVKAFLGHVDITGVKGVEITDETKMLVASSAVIPVFNFQEWEFFNLGEVLIYPADVDTRIEEEKIKNKILGQVRPFQSKLLMLLSQESLEQGFRSVKDNRNTGFHEIAHIIDQVDGDIDGIPVVMPEELVKPWTDAMYREMKRIRKGKSDINPYGATSEAEFFAVVSEYFFENPKKFREKHPELYDMMYKSFSGSKGKR